MDWITGLFHKVDVTAVIASALTFIAGLSLVRSRLIKALSVIGDLADLLASIRTASEDGKFSSDEIKAIAKEGEELIAEFKK